MTTTTTRPSGLIDAEADLRRQPVEFLLDWVNERPAAVPFEACLPAVAAAVGHDVTLEDVAAACLAAVQARGTAGSRALGDAIDVLLDVRLCEACRDVIPDGTSHVNCGDVGADFCDGGCHDAFHAGGRCDAVAYR